MELIVIADWPVHQDLQEPFSTTGTLINLGFLQNLNTFLLKRPVKKTCCLTPYVPVKSSQQGATFLLLKGRGQAPKGADWWNTVANLYLISTNFT